MAFNEVPDTLDGPSRPWRSNTCQNCAHFGGSWTCQAFPQGIPQDIYRQAYGHREPYPGDGGIVFAQRPERPDPVGGYEIPEFLKRK